MQEVFIILIFAAVMGLLLYLSFKFNATLLSRDEPMFFTALVGMFALWFLVILLSLIPIDIFFTSMNVNSHTGLQTDPNGLVRTQSMVRDIYIILFGIVMIFSFFLIPLAYFYYENLDDWDFKNNGNFKSQACCASLKSTIGFVILFFILFLVGYLVFDEEASGWRKVESSLDDFSQSALERSISFVLAVFGIVGIFGQITYTAYGLTQYPLSFLQDARTGNKMSIDVLEDHHKSKITIERSIARLKKQHGNAPPREWTSKSRVELRKLTRQLSVLDGDLKRITRRKPTCWEKFKSCCWRSSYLLRVVAFFFTFTLNLLIIISLALFLLDRALHSKCGMSCAWQISEGTIPNPINFILWSASAFFPLDFVIFASILLTLFISTIYALSKLGMRCGCFQLFEFDPEGTMHNGFLLVLWFLMFIIFSFVFILQDVSNEYLTFGHQFAVRKGHEIQCNIDISTNRLCVKTVIYGYLENIRLGLPIFGNVIFFGSWCIIASYFLMAIYAFCRYRKNLEYTPIGDSGRNVELL